MPAIKGRTLTLSWEEAAVAGVRTKSIAANAEPIDISDDDSAGWRELLADAGQATVSVSVSGIMKDDTLRVVAHSPDARVGTVNLAYPDGGEIEGEFFLASYTETGEYNGAVTFEATFESTGAIAYTPPTP